jgi:hypothetical protein
MMNSTGMDGSEWGNATASHCVHMVAKVGVKARLRVRIRVGDKARSTEHTRDVCSFLLISFWACYCLLRVVYASIILVGRITASNIHRVRAMDPLACRCR